MPLVSENTSTKIGISKVSYVNSNVNIKLDLVDMFEIPYSESGKSYKTITDDFVGNTDVNNRRNQICADVAVLLIDKDLVTNPSPPLAETVPQYSPMHQTRSP